MENQAPRSPLRGQRALAAIVVTDGVGFSARMVEDEEQTLNLICRDLDLMSRLCHQMQGQVLKNTGDGLLMYFVSAVQAVTCAIEIQKALMQASKNLSPTETLAHRIGIHLGDVFFSETDVMGTGVNIAARLQSLAVPQGICLSKTVYDVVKGPLALNATYLGPLKLKNIQEAVPAYQIVAGAKAQNLPSDNMEAPAIAVEELINQRYRVQRVLGRGGFGRTYLAQDIQRFDDLCVLKEFLPLNKTEYVLQKARQLFEREARTLYQVNHPQIPRFLAWFTDRERLFIVQEFIDGRSYANLLKDRRKRGLAFSESEVVQWLRDLLPVLDYLHQRNIIHRDISPDNMMRARSHSKPILIDFGLVKQTISQMWSMDKDGSPAPGSASFVGKIGYAPPEQMRMGQCYPCSDLYALGVTAIVLLTGKEPGVLAHQDSLEWQWRSSTKVGDGLAQIIDGMLAEKPGDRYPSAPEVLADLNRLVGPAPPPPPPLRDRSLQPVAEPAAGSLPPSPPAALTQPPLEVLDPEFLERCQYELSRRIGPMASCIVADALAESPHISAEQLTETLAAEIPNQQQAAEFRDYLSTMLIPRYVSRHSQLEAPTPPPQERREPPEHREPIAATPKPQAAHTANSSTALTAEFLERCRLELARCIGPMASYIVEDLLDQNPHLTRQQLIAAIAAEIPSPEQATKFQQSLR